MEESGRNKQTNIGIDQKDVCQEFRLHTYYQNANASNIMQKLETFKIPLSEEICLFVCFGHFLPLKPIGGSKVPIKVAAV